MPLQGMIRFAVMIDNTILGDTISLTKPKAASYLPNCKADSSQKVRVVRLNISEIRTPAEAKQLARARANASTGSSIDYDNINDPRRTGE